MSRMDFGSVCVFAATVFECDPIKLSQACVEFVNRNLGKHIDSCSAQIEAEKYDLNPDHIKGAVCAAYGEDPIGAIQYFRDELDKLKAELSGPII